MKKCFWAMAALVCCLAAIAQTDAPNRGYNVDVGGMAPDVKLQFTDSTVRSLGDYRGRVVMLQFTASWCGVCREEMPHIEAEIWQQHKDDPGFALPGIDLKEDKATTGKFRADAGVTYPICLDPDGSVFGMFTTPRAGVTRNIVIDRQGRIVFLTRLYDPEEFGLMKECIARELAREE